jgi:hypothetical protein
MQTALRYNNVLRTRVKPRKNPTTTLTKIAAIRSFVVHYQRAALLQIF